VQIVINQTQKVTGIVFATGSSAGITTGNNFGIGIYSEDGSTKVFAINVAGVVAISTAVRTTITPVTLAPGVYWLAWVATLTTVTMNSFTQVANLGYAGSLAGSTKRWGWCAGNANTSSAGSLPSSIFLPDTLLIQTVPLIMLEPS
jgi:hypothetical protein